MEGNVGEMGLEDGGYGGCRRRHCLYNWDVETELEMVVYFKKKSVVLLTLELLSYPMENLRI